MRISDIEPKISVTSTGYSGGQTDMVMTVKLAGETVASMDYSVYQDQPAIEYIRVLPEYQGRGIGKLMIRELQRQYPEQEIQWGYTTPEGTRLYQSIKHQEIPRPEIIKRLNHLKKVKRELQKLQHRLDNMPEDQRGRWIQSVGDRWNRYYDIVSRLEYQLGNDSKTHKRIVDLDN